MGKPLDSKPIQIYANDELYSEIKALVDSKEYRSLNVAVLSLVEIGLKYREQANNADPIGNVNLIEKLQAQILELSDSLANTVKHSDIAEILSNPPSDRYLTQDDLKTLEDRLKKLESLIGNSATGQTKQVLPISQNEIAIEQAEKINKFSPLGDVSYTREQLTKMTRDEVRTIYKHFVPSTERPKGSELYVDTILKPKMIDIILERQNLLRVK